MAINCDSCVSSAFDKAGLNHVTPQSLAFLIKNDHPMVKELKTVFIQSAFETVKFDETPCTAFELSLIIATNAVPELQLQLKNEENKENKIVGANESNTNDDTSSISDSEYDETEPTAPGEKENKDDGDGVDLSTPGMFHL